MKKFVRTLLKAVVAGLIIVAIFYNTRIDGFIPIRRPIHPRTPQQIDCDNHNDIGPGCAYENQAAKDAAERAFVNSPSNPLHWPLNTVIGVSIGGVIVATILFIFISPSPQ